MILTLTRLILSTTRIAGRRVIFRIPIRLPSSRSTQLAHRFSFRHNMVTFLVIFLCRPNFLMGIVLLILSYCVLMSGLRCPLRFPYEMMFGSSFSSVVCFTAYVLFMHLFVFILLPRIDCMSSVASIYQKHNMLTLHEQLGSPRFSCLQIVYS